VLRSARTTRDDLLTFIIQNPISRSTTASRIDSVIPLITTADQTAAAAADAQGVTECIEMNEIRDPRVWTEE